jgi:hypothetical protein
MATPTFIAGACVVIVATLAYGTTQTHLLYSGMPPACQAASCLNTGPNGGNGVTLKTSARPAVGDRRTPDAGRVQTRTAGQPTPGTPQRTSSSSPSTGAPGGQTVSPPPPVSGDGQSGPHVAIWFRELKIWDGGFLAVVTIVNHSDGPLAGWQLWMRYKVTQIDHVWNARFFQQSPASRSAGMMVPGPRQPAVLPGGSERFTFKASGPPAVPAGCEFDGYACSFRTEANSAQKGSPQGGMGPVAATGHVQKMNRQKVDRRKRSATR